MASQQNNIDSLAAAMNREQQHRASELEAAQLRKRLATLEARIAKLKLSK
jgi:hypothetical protein